MTRSYSELCDEFQEVFSFPVALKEPPPVSLFTISGFPNHENVWSNVYQYFLGKAKSALNELFLFALQECIPDRDLRLESYTVEREVKTNLGGRIDLVIHDEADKTKAILIENKVYHTVNNNLLDYYNTFAQYADRVLIVLTLDATPVDERFFNVKHIDWINAIRKRLGEYLNRIDAKDLIFLQDFIQHVESFYEKPMEKEAFKFLYNHAAKIEALNQLQREAKTELQDQMLRNLPVPWAPYRTAANSVGVQREDTCLFLFVTTDSLFKEGDHHYILQLWIRGEPFVKKWDTAEALPEIDGIRPQRNSGTKEWILIASKKYPLDLNGLENFGTLIRSHLEGEWEEYAERVLGLLN